MHQGELNQEVGVPRGQGCRLQLIVHVTSIILTVFFQDLHSSENSSDMSDMSNIRPLWSDMSDMCLFGLICLIFDDFCLISDHFPPNICKFHDVGI